MNSGVIVSLQIGLPREMVTANATDPHDRPWTSGYVKTAVTEPVWASKTGITGDGQADLKHHGGPEKAILAYAASHYATWQQELNKPEFGPGALGENLTIEGFDEHTVCLDDTFRVGEVLLQVSQPRQPCWKISRRWNVRDLTQRVYESGRTGWYLRVLNEGWLQVGEKIELIERPTPQWTIARLNKRMQEDG